MSAVIASSVEYQPGDQAGEDTWAEPELESEEPIWEPRRIHLPRALIWATLSCFVLVVVVTSLWGLTHSTLTYGMAPVDSATSVRLAQIRHELASAGVPESALRHLTLAAGPGINIGDAFEALVDADQDLEAWSKIPAVATDRTELRSILARLNRARYGWEPVTPKPIPTLVLPREQKSLP